jgi:hypothetical protein
VKLDKTHYMKVVMVLMVPLFATGLLLLAGCGGGSTTVTSTVTETSVKTVTSTATMTKTDTKTTTQNNDGPYTSESAAEGYVQSQGSMELISPDSTWNQHGTLHVLHATPQGGASYGGDYYYFFVDGNAIANEIFTSASSDSIVDSTTFSVTFNVYMPGDPHCCPSGGTSTVQFQWDGSQLVTMGSMQGAEMS